MSEQSLKSHVLMVSNGRSADCLVLKFEFIVIV